MSTDKTIADLYDKGMLRMRIAKLFDLRMSEVNAAIERGKAAKPIPAKDWGDHVAACQRTHAADLAEAAKGKPRRVKEVQAAVNARRPAKVSLPGISFLDDQKK